MNNYLTEMVQTRMPTVANRRHRARLLAAGIGCLLGAFLLPSFRDPEGFLTGIVCLPLSIGFALIILGWTLSTPWQSSAAWFAMACVGQAVALQLILAGSELRYQHYRPLTRQSALLTFLLLAFMLFQAVAAIFALRSDRQAIWFWVRRNLRWWQVVCIFTVFALSSTVVSEDVAFYAKELPFAVIIQVVNLATIVLMVRSLPEDGIARLGQRFERIFGPFTTSDVRQPGNVDRFALAVAVWITLFAVFSNLAAYERHPHVPDEVAYLIQARFFAAGAVKMPAPPVPQAFDVYLMQITPAWWYPSPPPGWPAMLAVGTFFGLPWLVNPTLAGINVLLIYILLLELVPKYVARLALFLTAVSPWYIFLGMSFMTHMWALTCALLAATGVAWCKRYGQSGWAWLGGLALGILALVRPLEATGVALLLGLWAIGSGSVRLRIFSAAGLVLGSIAVASLTFVYNSQLTGDPRVFPIMAYSDERFSPNANSYGFGADRGMGWALDPNPGHGLLDALINSNLNIASLNTELFGWSTGSLLLIALFLFTAKPRKSDYLMWAVIAVIYWLHFFYYYSGGPDFGARYWFLMFVPLVVLSVRGMQVLAQKLESKSVTSTMATTRVLVAVFSLCILALVNFFPWRMVDKYQHFRGMRADVRNLAEIKEMDNSLVLIQGEQHPDFASAIVYNPLNLTSHETIFAWDRDPEVRSRLLETYADRPVWIIQGPSLTHKGYEIVAGPLTPQQLARLNSSHN
jgi:hypothetical protein